MTDGESSELRIVVSRDHDDECSVTATLTAGAFRGSGHAWLHIEDVSEFARATKQLASTSAGEATLRGGYVAANGSPDYTVNLYLLPHGRRGHVLLKTELASDPPASNASVEAVSRVFAALVAEPAALERFATQLSNIPKGGTTESVVAGEGAV